MPSYFEHFGSKGRKPDIALDVVEFDMPETLPSGIEVEERQFDTTGELLAHIAREIGRVR